jgi:hypothetical protein
MTLSGIDEGNLTNGLERIPALDFSTTIGNRLRMCAPT